MVLKCHNLALEVVGSKVKKVAKPFALRCEQAHKGRLNKTFLTLHYCIYLFFPQPICKPGWWCFRNTWPLGLSCKLSGGYRLIDTALFYRIGLVHRGMNVV